MELGFWGTRGSIPSGLTPAQVEDKICQAILRLPGLATNDEQAVRAYVSQLPPLLRGTAGGDTPCVQVQAQGDMFIIDAGTGLRKLGLELMKGPCGRGEGTVHLFISHTHWDHVQGFPFFDPVYVPGNRIFIYGVHDLKRALEGQQHPLYYPVLLSRMEATLEFVPLQAGQSISIGQVRISTLKNPHPGDSYSFRFEDQHSVMVYASDAEYKRLDEAGVQPHIEFFGNADALIFDAQYTLREGWQKVDWGHSSAMIGIDLARAAGVKRLILFHHDPTYSDADLEEIQLNAMAYQAQDQSRPACEIIVAYEGLTLDLAPTGAMGWQLAPNGETAILTPSRVFDESGVKQLAQQLGRLAGQNPSSIIDLSQVETLTTASLKSLVTLRQTRPDVPIVLAAPSASVQQVIKLAGYQDHFAVYPSVQAALAAAQAREALNLPGQVIGGRYQIQSKLGESLLGVTIKVTDTQADRPATLKTLASSFSQETIDQFMRQARQIAALDHGNIVKVFAWEREGARTFQVAEFVAGQTLHDLLGQGHPRLSSEQAVNIILEVARALEYAHGRGVIHGDLKPQNIFLTAGSVKVGDFGLGRLVEGRNLFESPALLVSPDYLAPEQILGQPLDARTDLYALGVIAYQLLTGRLPFEGSAQEVMRAHLYQPPLPPREVNPHISLSQEHLILKLLAKNPNERYASAEQARHISTSLTPGTDEAAWRRVFLVGREKQLQALQACWQEAQAGRGQLVFVTGEQGIGKTTLSQQAAALSEAAVLLTGQCQEVEGSPAYHLFAQILQAYFATVPPEFLDESARPLLASFAHLIPEIREALPDLPEPPRLEPAQEQLRLMSHLTQFVKLATRERPWFIILDDLQWADSGSLELLRYLGRHLPSLPLLILGTYRDVELERGHPLLATLQDLGRHPSYVHLPLDRLDQAGVGQMLHQLWRQAVPLTLVHKIYQHTGGNPFYVEEVARGLVDEGLIGLQDGQWHFPDLEDVRLPPSMHEAVWRRISHLDPDTQNLLRQAAVLGPTFKFDDLHVMSGLSTRQVLEHLDVALERQLVQETPGDSMLRFRHPEIQRVLYEDLGILRRRVLHRQAAEALTRRHWPDTKPVAEALAHHFYQAGEFEQAIIYSLQAARQAQAAYANRSALLWYRRTLEVLDQMGLEKAAEFQTSLVSAHQSLGEILTSLDHYDAALEHCVLARILVETLPPSPEQSRQLADLYRQTAQIHERRSEYDLALTWLNKALRCIEKDEPTSEMARIYSLFSRVYTRLGSYKIAKDYLEHTLTVAQATRLRPMEAESFLGLGIVSYHLGDYASTMSYSEQALAISSEIGDRGKESQAFNHMGLALMVQRAEAASHFEHALSICRETGDRHLEGMLLNNLGIVYYYLHDYARASAYHEQSLRSKLEIGNRYGEGTSLVSLGDVHERLGNYPRARVCYERALDIFRELGSRGGQSEVLVELGLLYHQLGNDKAACEYSQEALSIAQDLGIRDIRERALTHLGHALRGLGKWVEAAGAYRQALALRQESGQYHRAMAALAGLACVCLAQGEPAQALAHVQEILAYLNLEGDAPYGVVESAWICLTCARVLGTCQDSRAQGILNAAYRWLQEQAAKIGDGELRRSFLENVAVHREIIREWQAASGG